MRPSFLPCILLVASSLLLSAPAHGADENPTTDELVERLGSKRFNERERAAKSLAERGPKVLPALRLALKHADGEVSTRAQKLIAALEIVEVMEPKRLTLDTNKQPLAVAINQIERQTGCKLLVDEKDPTALYSFQMKGATLWEVLQKLNAEAGLVHVDYRAGTYKLVPGIYTSPFRWSHGSFWLVAQKFDEHKSIDFSELGMNNERTKQDDYLKLAVSVRVEPRFLILGFDEPEIEIALDENGKAFGKTNTTEDRKRLALAKKTFDGETVYLCLHRTDKNAKAIRELRGWIPVRVVVERKRVLVTDDFLKSNGTKFQLGEATYEIANTRHLGNIITSLSISGPRFSPEIDSRWPDRVRFEDADGNRWVSETNLVTQTADEEIRLTYFNT